MKLNMKKICPECKCSDFIRIKRKLWMKFFPGFKHYQCQCCNHRFITFFEISSLFENRNHHRYQPGPDCCVKLLVNEQESARLVDISRNGVCLLCPEDISDSDQFQINIQSRDLSESLNLQVKKISQKPFFFYQEFCSQPAMTKINGKFVDFHFEQKRQLDTFIRALQEEPGI